MEKTKGMKLAHDTEEPPESVVAPDSEEVAAEDVVDPLLSVDDSDPLLSVAQDSQELDEVIVVLAANGMVPDSQEVAADGVALDSQEPDEGITPVGTL